MPYKSTKQKNFFRMCAHNPESAKGACPPKKVISEFERAQKKKKDRRHVKFY